VVEDHPASRQIISLQLEVLGLEVQVCESASAALELLGQQDFDVLLTDQSIPGMQGSELAKHIRSLGHREIVIIGITADIYALDSREQFLAAGMNGVLIKPLNLMTLENELARHFISQEITDEQEVADAAGEYSFDLFSNLLKQNPSQILLILEEIKKVHIQTLNILKTEPIDENSLASMLHKIKGGAQLLSAPRFVQSCEALELVGPLPDRVNTFIALLVEQNLMIDAYAAKHASL
jgi:two-component system sensor histidine kinase EvgS